jgi:hypothetical protein
MGKTGPVPKGCGGNPAILRCRPCAWNNQTLRTPPRLAGFPLATPSTPVVLTGPITACITSCAKGKTGCELGSSCTIKEPLARVNETIAGVLKSISIQDLAEHEPQAGREHGDQMQAVGGLVALTIE